tara:strand:- start:61601 stop:63088 length:1488 start_codon:yes stop_codon:yes gene_type:complete
VLDSSAKRDVVVIGGGIAGIAAATALAEQGVRVSLIEGEQYLGGRAGAWTETLANGDSQEMERGFHAFFRQYYSLRKLLRRVDPNLEMLEQLHDYPIYGPDGASESFSNLPATAPFNVIALTHRTKTLSLRDLMKVDARAAMRMLAFDGASTYEDYDEMSAGEYLDSLRFPPAARRMLFDVFAHSFFNPENTMSAGELLMMFHFYFMGNREGLVFDVCKRPMSEAFWTPFEGYLRGLGVKLHLGEYVRSVRKTAAGYQIGSDGQVIDAKDVVLALSVPALKTVLANSPDLHDGEWSEKVQNLDVTRPFVVWRLWLDKATHAGRKPFVGTSGLGIIDNISLYHLFQDESRQWAEEHGGSVVELHAYGVPSEMPEDKIRADLLAALHSLYPETANARVIDERYLLRQDCPDFSCGTYKNRPGVETPHANVFLAGDFVRLPFPSALMERAAASGFSAANKILDRAGKATEAIESVAPRGMLASLMKVAPILSPRPRKQ